MTRSIEIALPPDPAGALREEIFARLTAFNERIVGKDNHASLLVTARDAAGDLAGGLTGDTYWGWLSIAILWVREDCRGEGIGTRLVRAAEEGARARGCRRAHVDTMDFQAPGFWERMGYRLFGVLDDLPEGHSRRFYWKDLA
jgi:GNAT superfamily N-acetyltransferase